MNIQKAAISLNGESFYARQKNTCMKIPVMGRTEKSSALWKNTSMMITVMSGRKCSPVRWAVIRIQKTAIPGRCGSFPVTWKSMDTGKHVMTRMGSWPAS
ncbi:MAG: hypothetical protein HFI70_15170 [Lachnospiraceae bacterium]|nr:hypothetical protein [Lachnospiraceae bacterium]